MLDIMHQIINAMKKHDTTEITFKPDIVGDERKVCRYQRCKSEVVNRRTDNIMATRYQRGN